MNPQDLIYLLMLMGGPRPDKPPQPQSAYTGPDDPARQYVNGAPPQNMLSAYLGGDDPAIYAPQNYRILPPREFPEGLPPLPAPTSAYTGEDDPAIRGNQSQQRGVFGQPQVAAPSLAGIMGGTDRPVNGVNPPQNMTPRGPEPLPGGAPSRPSTAISGTETPAIYNAPPAPPAGLAALMDPTVQRALMSLGAGIGGQGSLADSISQAGTQFLDQRQSAELLSRAMAGEDLGEILGDPMLAGVPQEAVDRATAARFQQEQLGQGERALDYEGERVEQGEQRLNLERIATEARIEATDRDLDLDEARMLMEERFRRAGLNMEEAKLQAEIELAKMRDATQRRGQSLTYEAAMARLRQDQEQFDAKLSAEGQKVPEPLSASTFNAIQTRLVQEFTDKLPPGSTFDTLRDLETGRTDPGAFFNALPTEARNEYLQRQIELERQARVEGGLAGTGLTQEEFSQRVASAMRGKGPGDRFIVAGYSFVINEEGKAVMQ